MENHIQNIAGEEFQVLRVRVQGFPLILRKLAVANHVGLPGFLENDADFFGGVALTHVLARQGGCLAVGVADHERVGEFGQYIVDADEIGIRNPLFFP